MAFQSNNDVFVSSSASLGVGLGVRLIARISTATSPPFLYLNGDACELSSSEMRLAPGG